MPKAPRKNRAGATPASAPEPRPADKKARPRKTTKPVEPVAAPAPTGPPVIYPEIELVEYSTTSRAGPLTAADWRVVLEWETEKEYQARKVKEVPDSKPEHWLYGDVYHCLDTSGDKVRCRNNGNNRPFDMGWCEEIIDMILHGQWVGPYTIPGETVNGETVRISRYGRVLSGQHQGTACILADEWLQAERGKEDYDAANPKYPFWNGQAQVFIETIVVRGLSEDERVLRTIDYVKPRTAADMLYTMEVFRQNKPAERKEMTRMLAAALDLLWTRTQAKGYKTHPELVGFLERHKRLLKCVEHLFLENGGIGRSGDATSRRISKLRISAGHAAALCYLMGCSSDKTTRYSDDYRDEMPPSEKNLDWSYWDRAQDFWTLLAGSRDFMPVQHALGRLAGSKPDSEENLGLGGIPAEKLAILAKAWEQWRDHPPQAGPAFSMEDLEEEGCLCLSYTTLDEDGKPLPPGQVKLIGRADFYGIDCPKGGTLGTGPTNRNNPVDPPAPSRAEIYGAGGLAEQAMQRRAAQGTTGKGGRSGGK